MAPDIVNMISDFELLLTDYAVSLSDGDTESIHERIAEAVGNDYEKMIQVADVLILFAKNGVLDGAWDAEEANRIVRQEYRDAGLSDVVMYKYMAPAVELAMDLKPFSRMSPEEQTGVIQDIITGNANTTHEVLKRAMYIFCLKALLRFRIAQVNIDLTRSLTSIIDGYTREEKDSAILPRTVMNAI